MSETRWQIVRARLSGSELIALRKLPGVNDSERLRTAIQHALGGDERIAALAASAVAGEAQARGDKLVSEVGKLVVAKVGNELEKRLTEALKISQIELGKIAGQAAADRIRPVIAELNLILGGRK